MIRKAFVMQVNPDKHTEYEKRHNPIWAELEQRWADVANTDICQKWWKHMADVMPSNPDNSPVSDDLKSVFFLK